MAHGGTDKYYNPANKVVNDGDTAFADDLNDINYAVDTALAQVADDLDVMDVKITTLSAESEAWAHNDQGIPPDPLEPAEFSSKAYATESKEYAIQAEGVPIHKADGTTQVIDSALVSATKAAASQVAALASKNAAALSETNAEAHSLQAWADQQVGFESMKDAQAAASAADASADLAALSAANLPNATTAGADKIIVTNSSGDGWDYVSRVGFGRKNLLINGGFDVWQRGTSFSTTGDIFSADRWYHFQGMQTLTISRQTFTLGQTDVPGGPTYFLRTVVGSGNTAAYVRYRLENLRRIYGETLTLSFSAKADTSTTIAVFLSQYFGTGGSPSPAVIGFLDEPVPLTTSWVRHTVTISVPSIYGETIGTNDDSFLEIWFLLSDGILGVSDNVINQTGTFDFANVQLEFGDTSTDFEYRHPAEELMLCQRYYETGSGGIPKVANMLSTDILRVNAIPFKVTKRVVPDMTIGILNPSGHDGTPGTINAIYPSTDEFCSQWNWTGGTAGRAVSAQFAWIADAEV